MSEYLVIVTKAGDNWSAYSPDVLGCGATGDTIEETLQNYQEALAFHFEGLIEDGLPIPEPESIARNIPYQKAA